MTQQPTDPFEAMELRDGTYRKPQRHSRITTVGELTASDIGSTVALDGVHVIEGVLWHVVHRQDGTTLIQLDESVSRGLPSFADCVVEGKA